MAGLGVDGGGNGKRRKSLDSSVNMIPMIDLLMVTISFLLITAVWSHMARLDASAKVPGPRDEVPPCDGAACEPPKELHVDMHAKEKFVLSWRQSGVIVKSIDVPRVSASTAPPRYAELRAAIGDEWRADGTHRAPTDQARDRAVLHTGNDARYDEMIAAMDAIYGVRRPGNGGAVEAFAVTFSVD